MVEIYDHILLNFKADMWSLWVERCLHTLVTCIARPKSDPRWCWYLAKFRSNGRWNIWKVWGNEVDNFPLGHIWTPWFATLLGMESGLHFLFLSISVFKKITPLSFADITWILWNLDWEYLCGMNEVLDLWMRGCMSGKSGCQYSEWVTDKQDIFG